MEFRILGPLEVYAEGRLLPLGGRKQRALLAVLLLHANEVVPGASLIEALWGDNRPKSAAKALQRHVSQLRKALGNGGALLRSRASGYALELAPGELDLERFQHLRAEARAAVAAADPAAAAAKLRQALSLWCGPALADFALEPFATVARARLEELRQAALEERVEAELALGHHAELVAELEALAAEHPVRERLRAQLMLALYRCGRQAEALRLYHETRQALVEKLGMEPGLELKRLEQAILRQDPELELPASVTPPARLPEPTAEPRVAPRPATAEERKIVTVLFVDLVGFTAQADRADPEDVRALLRPYHTQAKEEIERFGGTVEKFVGDAVMAVFGAPIAHEDDAERAVRASFAVLGAVAELNAAHPGLGLEVRAAVNTGEAIVELAARPEAGESIAAGDVVNTTSRLQEAAPPGAVLVGERTYETTRDVVEYEELAPVTVKGKRAPVRVWRARALRRRRGEAEPPPPAPFIGRDQDLALLEQTYARTLRESSLQLVTVVGEPGVGKTRLVREFRTVLEGEPEAPLWRQGRCLPYGDGITFWALGEIVKAQTGILESDSPEEASEKLAAAVELVVEEASDRDWFIARLGALVGASTSESAPEPTESFTAWRRFLEAIASSRPLVLVFEDLHWADTALLEFLEHLVDWATGVPLLVVCTARPELYERKAGWGGGKGNSNTISLSPLTDEETAELISALLSDAVLPPDTLAELLERSEGNPLYAEEFVRMLTDRGILTRHDGTATIAPGAEIQVPETVQALIAARLDTLAPDRKSLLHDAAVFGKVFWAGALSAMGGLDERTVRDGLHELARKELVRPARTSSVRNDEEYAFWHVLVRDVAYSQIPRAARVTKHRTAAAWIERMSEDRTTDHAEFLAHHYAQALDLARVTGAEDEAEELEEPAARFLIMAGDRAFSLDVGKADSYYRRALELFPPGHPERARVLGKAAEAAWLAGRLAEAERDCEKAIEEFRAHGNPLGEGEAMVRVATVLKFRGETSRAWALLQGAVELLEREPHGPELVRAYAQTARDHSLAADFEECLRFSEKALTLARKHGMEEQVVLALQTRGGARCDLGDYGGLDDLREARRMAIELGVGHEIGRSHNNLGHFVLYAEGPASAHEIFRSGIELSQRRGLTPWVMWGKAHLLWTLFDLGEWDELLEVAEELISLDRIHGRTYVGPWALSFKAHVLWHQGDAEAAAALESEFLSRARELGDPQVLGAALVIAAFIEKGRAGVAAAVGLIRELEEVTRGRRSFRSQHLADAVRICAAAGASELLERLFEGAEPGSARARHSLLTARAVLAEAQGHLEQAADLYDEACRGWAEYGHVLERGQVLFGAGRCLLAVGRPEEAAAPLAEARRVFVGLGAGPLVAEVDALREPATT